MDVMHRKICFIGAGLQGGGIERAFTSLANHYQSKGYTVSVILLFKTEHFFKLHDEIYVVEPSIKRSNFHRYLYAALLVPYVRKNLKQIKPDVILSFGEWFNSFVILATKGLRFPVFISDRMSPGLKLGFPLDSAKNLLYKRAAGIIAQTKYAASVIHQRTKASNIRVIPNPLNLFQYPEKEKKNFIITVGRLAKEKGHEYLIRAFAIEEHQRWLLHIIGDGPIRQSLEALAEKLGVADRVIFHGHLKDFAALLAESKIFVLPSLKEGFPNALIEAMSVPLACISSDCIAGPSDIINHGVNGLLVKPGDVEQLRGAIVLLTKNENLREQLAKEAMRIRTDLDFTTIANQYLEFVLKRHQP
jgi:GalNAc-alpha-(1->4)-GalNAc-alpha-(1->3)-diNAcBac-PP-undecaprenol alpha-1,4-N-acetyl-D-galactosaminyltransferase